MRITIVYILIISSTTRVLAQGTSAYPKSADKFDVTQNEGVFIDLRDGQNYKWVRIGEQVWMAENLNYETTSGSWCYDNDTTLCKYYGRLYQWDAAIEGCPAGWHLPSKDEFKQLFRFVKQNRNRSKWKVAISLKSCRHRGSPYGNECDTNEDPKWKRRWFSKYGTDDYNFSALPGGGRKRNGNFLRIGIMGFWWTSTEVWEITAFHFYTDYSRNKIKGKHLHRDYGISVRCVRDE